MILENKLKQWAEKTADFYHQKATSDDKRFDLAFYTQSDLTKVKQSPELMILAINPGIGGTYSDQIESDNWKKWGIDKRMDGATLLKGNPAWDTRNTWVYWQRINNIFNRGGINNILQDESNFVLSNLTFFSTANEKLLPNGVFEECAEKTIDLVNILQPKNILCLGKDSCLEPLKKNGNFSVIDLLPFGLLRYGKYNGISVYGIKHPSSPYTVEEMELVGKCLKFLFDNPDKTLTKEDIEKKFVTEIQAVVERKSNKTQNVAINISDISKQISLPLLYETGITNYDNHSERYLLTDDIRLTVTKTKPGYVAIRHKDFSEKYSVKEDYSHQQALIKLLQEKGYVDGSKDVWLGVKNFSKFGSTTEDVISNIVEEVRELKAEIEKIFSDELTKDFHNPISDEIPNTEKISNPKEVSEKQEVNLGDKNGKIVNGGKERTIENGKVVKYIANSSGTYVYLRENGFNYKRYIGKNLFYARTGKKLSEKFHTPVTDEIPTTATTNSFEKVADSNPTNFVNELNAKYKKIRRLKILSRFLQIITLLAFVVLVVDDIVSEFGSSDLSLSISMTTFILLVFWTIFFFWYKRRKTVFITYELDEAIEPLQDTMQSAFKEFSKSKKKWEIVGTEKANYKYDGAGAFMIRKKIKGYSKHKLPTLFLKTNIKIPYIGLRKAELYFFPDFLLIKRKKRLAFVEYKNLYIDIHSGFIETEGVSSDATITDYTYQYLNRDGSKDKRFANNSRFPICDYPQYYFKSDVGLDGAIMLSKSDALHTFVALIMRVAAFQKGELLDD